MQHDGYFTRALRANDPRYARVFGKMGYNRTDLVATKSATAAPTPATPPAEPQADDLAALREQYQDVVGKRAYHGWGADELRRRIAEAGKA